MVAGVIADIEKKARLYIKNEHGREGVEAVFTHHPNEKKIECNACRAAREKAGKGKGNTKTSKMNKMGTPGDAYNFQTTHCTSEAHLHALGMWGGLACKDPPALVKFVGRLKTLESSFAGSDGQDSDYHYAGTSVYKHLIIKNHLPHCSACDMQFSIFQNKWKKSVADHFLCGAHKSNTKTKQQSVASFFGPTQGKQSE